MQQLDPNKAKQLDSNIRKMLEGGATEDDVKKYAADFNAKFSAPVKKKDQSTSTVQKKSSASVPTNGSSGLIGLPKDNFGNNVLPVPEKTENKDIPKNTFTPGSVAYAHIENQKSDPRYSQLYQDFKSASVVAPEKVKEIEQSVDSELNNDGFFSGLLKGLTTMPSLPKWLGGTGSVENTPMQKEKEEAKKELQAQQIEAKRNKQPAPPITNESINQRVRQIAIEKRVKDKSDSQIRDFLSEAENNKVGIGDLNEKQYIEQYAYGERATMNQKDQLSLKKQEILKPAIDNAVLSLQTIGKQAEQYINNNKPVPEEIAQKYKQQYSEYQDLVKDAISTKEEYVNNIKDLGSLMENIDVVKRDYGWGKNFATNLGATVLDLDAGALGALDYIGQFMPTIGTYSPELRKGNKGLREIANNERQSVMKPISVDEISSPTDLGRWMSNTVISQQVPIFALIATGAGGIATIGATSTGQKYEEMQDEVESGDMQYSTAQKIGIPLAFGATETASAAVDYYLFKSVGRAVRSATEPERRLIAKGMAEGLIDFAKNTGGQALKATTYEGVDEGTTQLSQNLIDIYAGGKKNVQPWDGVKDAAAAGAAMGLLLPMGGKVVSLATQPFSVDTNIQKASDEIVRLEKALGNPELSEETRQIIEKQLSKSETRQKQLVEKVSRRVQNMPDNDFQQIVKLEKQQANLRNNGQEIESDPSIDEDTKKMLLGNLKADFDKNNNQRLEILGRKPVSNTVNEEEPTTEDEEEVDNEESVSTEPAPEQTTEDVSEQLKAITEKLDSIREKAINNGMSEEGADKAALSSLSNEEYAILTDSKNRITNESTPGQDTAVDGNVQPGTTEMGEVSANPEAANVEQQDSQPAADIAASEGTNEVVDEAQNDVNYALSEIEKGVTLWDSNPYSARVDLGISRADIRKGESDLKAGKINSVPAKRLVEALKLAKEKGEYDYIEGSGSKINKFRLPISDLVNPNTESINTEEEDFIMAERETLANEYDEYFNSLDEDTQQQILEQYETNNKREVSENAENRESAPDVSNQEKPARKRAIEVNQLPSTKKAGNVENIDLGDGITTTIETIEFPDGDVGYSVQVFRDGELYQDKNDDSSFEFTQDEAEDVTKFIDAKKRGFELSKIPRKEKGDVEDKTAGKDRAVSFTVFGEQLTGRELEDGSFVDSKGAKYPKSIVRDVAEIADTKPTEKPKPAEKPKPKEKKEEPTDIDLSEKLRLNSLTNFLNQIDDDLGNFGSETLGVNIPIVIARVAVKAMKAAVATAKTSADILSAGLNAVKKTQWYKNLTIAEQQDIDNDFQANFVDKIANLQDLEDSFVIEENTRFQQILENTRRKFQDKLLPIRNLQKKIERFTGQRSENTDFDSAEVLMHGKASNDLAEFGKVVETLGKNIAKAGLTQEQLSDYLYARHAKERNKHIRDNIDPTNESGSGMSDIKADEVIASFTPAQIAKLDALSKEVYDIIQSTRQIFEEYGLESAENVEGLRNQFENYVPLKGFAEDELNGDEYGGSGSSSIGVQGRDVRRAAGRGSKAANVLANVIADHAEAIIRARKNEVMQKLYNLAKENPNSNIWEIYSEGHPDTKKVNVGGKVRNQPVDMKGNDQYVGVKVDGKQFYIKFANKELGKLINGATVQKSGLAIKVLNSMNRFLSATMTAYNPEFVVSNFSRDAQTAMFNLLSEQDISENSVKGKKLLKDFSKTVAPAIRTIFLNETGRKPSNEELNKYYEEFKADGAKTGWFYSKSTTEIAKDVQSIINLQTAKPLSPKKIKQGLLSAKDFVDNVNTSIENAVRLASYVAARKAGVSRTDSATLAKELTVNFNKSGEYGSTLNAIYLFFNASVQGSARFAKAMLTLKKTVKDNGKISYGLNKAQKLAAGVTVFSSALTLLNLAVSDDDDDGVSFYMKIPDYVKERNIIIMAPNGKDYYKIPLPYGYNIFHNFGMATTEVAMGEREKGNAIGFMSSATIGAFSPVNFAQSDKAEKKLVQTASPTVLKPALDIAMNENFFGSSIYSENFPGQIPKPDSSMGRPTTPKAFINMAQFMNQATGGDESISGNVDISPETLNYLFRFGIGGTGRFIDNTMETTGVAIDKAKGEDVDFETKKVPFLRVVAGEPDPYRDQDVYMDRKTEIGQLYQSYKNASPEQKKDEKYNRIVYLYQLVKSTDKQLKNLRKRKDKYDDMEDEQKRLKGMKAAEEKHSDAVSKFNKKYNEIRK